MSAPPAALVIADPICAAAAAFTPSSAAFAAGAPGVPAAASVAASAALIAVSDVCFAACRPAAAAAFTPRHAGREPISTFMLPGPGPSIGGRCATESVTRAAGAVGISISIQLDERSLQGHDRARLRVEGGARLDLDVRLRGDLHAHALHLHLPGGRLDHDVRLRRDRDRVVLAADDDLLRPLLVDDLD